MLIASLAIPQVEGGKGPNKSCECISTVRAMVGQRVLTKPPIVPQSSLGIAPALKCINHAAGVHLTIWFIGPNMWYVGGMSFLSGSLVMETRQRANINTERDQEN